MAVSAQTDKLDRVMFAAREENAPPEVLFEIMEEAAAQYREYAREMGWPGLERTAQVIHESAMTLIDEFGGHQADIAWRREVAEMPWWKRLWLGSIAPSNFRWRWSAEMRAYGRELVAEALKEEQL